MKIRWDGKGLEIRFSERRSLYVYPFVWGWSSETTDEGERMLVRGPFVYVEWRYPQ